MSGTASTVVYEGRWCAIVRLPRPSGRKTDIFEVVANDGGLALGQIRWYGRWRTYALYPKADTVWEATCLGEISTWLSEMTWRHRRKILLPPDAAPTTPTDA